MPHKILVAALSDVGCIRTNNEDSFGYDPARQVYVVCDGMGGMAAGEVASQMAVATFLQTIAAGSDGVPVETMLDQAIRAANASVHQAGLLPAHKGMGTTMVAACIQEGKLYIGNVGDSRAYLIQHHQCTQITIDHSYINELIRTGVVDVKDAGKVDVHGMQTMITRAIGVEPTVDPDFFSPGDVVLLASDGLTRYVEQNELSLLVGSCDLDGSAKNLVAVAKERGGTDNITVLLLQLAAETAVQPEASSSIAPQPDTHTAAPFQPEPAVPASSAPADDAMDEVIGNS